MEEQLTASITRQEPAQENPGRMQVLLIDDEPAIVRMVSLILSCESDFDLVVATTGGEALQHAVPGRVDLVLLDLHLSDIDSMVLLTKLRAALAAPIAVFSASTEREVEEACMAAGATAFIGKPFEPDSFAARLRAIIASSKPSC
jgi:DNA-binding response OmpR family regulator